MDQLRQPLHVRYRKQADLVIESTVGCWGALNRYGGSRAPLPQIRHLLMLEN